MALKDQEYIHPRGQGLCGLQAGKVDVGSSDVQDIAEESLQVAPVVTHELLRGELVEAQPHSMLLSLLPHEPHVDMDPSGGGEGPITDCDIEHVSAMRQALGGNNLAIGCTHGEVSAQAFLPHQAVGQCILGVPVCGMDFAYHAALKFLLPRCDEDLQWEGGGRVTALLRDVYSNQR